MYVINSAQLTYNLMLGGPIMSKIASRDSITWRRQGGYGVMIVGPRMTHYHCITPQFQGALSYIFFFFWETMWSCYDMCAVHVASYRFGIFALRALQ